MCDSEQERQTPISEQLRSLAKSYYGPFAIGSLLLPMAEEAERLEESNRALKKLTASYCRTIGELCKLLSKDLPVPSSSDERS